MGEDKFRLGGVLALLLTIAATPAKAERGRYVPLPLDPGHGQPCESYEGPHNLPQKVEWPGAVRFCEAVPRTSTAVVLRFDLDEEGRPVSIETGNMPLPCLEDPAAEALAEWRFCPVMELGHPRRVYGLEVRIGFREG